MKNYFRFWVFSAIVGLAGCGFTRYPDATNSQSAGSTAPTSVNPPTQTTTPSDPVTGSPATFSQVNQQILQPKCVGCHASGSSPDFSSYSSFAQSTAYVVAGNAAQSSFYTAVSSGRMPQGGTALTQAELSIVSSWIDAGAKND
jgi:uncharacterized membrane protein